MGAACALLVAAACKPAPYALDPGASLDASLSALPPYDAGPAPDAGAPCLPSAELCNGKDDDCDGKADEDFELATDPSNCGACGSACQASHAFGTCKRGKCSYACEPNFRDTDHSLRDGCEEACAPTPDARELCNGLDDDCDGKVDEDFDLMTDAKHCGTCDHVCSGAHGGGVICNAGSCEIASCNAGYAHLPGHQACSYRCPVVPAGSEVCNGVDDDCDGKVDEEAAGLGDPCTDPGFETQADTGACTFGTKVCAGNLTCVGYQGPRAETCNQLDDDCDGVVDEDTGTEICNGLDDDCDTQIDEGLTCVSCAGGSELCNGQDDDCDGQIDELWPALGTVCNNGQRYGCKRVGVVTCTADGSNALCNAEPIAPEVEQCNGKDDDCDGVADEDAPAHPLASPVGDACGGIPGSCNAGFFKCTSGQLACDTSTATAELCNGKDDDCDGFVDEDVQADVGLPCVPLGQASAANEGACTSGHTDCVAGAIACHGYTGPTAEVCNGLDDDCNGSVDDDAYCPNPDGLCDRGRCLAPCSAAPCPFGYFCASLAHGPYCAPDPCTHVKCAANEACDQGSGQCAKICGRVHCAPGEQCVGGACVDCFVAGCSAGRMCVANLQGVGICDDDRCKQPHCKASEECVDGACHALECDPGCAADEQCVAGTCVPNRCQDVSCKAGSLCDPKRGLCVADRCAKVSCGPGLSCDHDNGTCLPNRCVTTVCPSGSQCILRFDGAPFCAHPFLPSQTAASERAQHTPLAAGGGGFTCSVAPRGAAFGRGSLAWCWSCWATLLLSLALVSRRRLRRAGRLGSLRRS